MESKRLRQDDGSGPVRPDELKLEAVVAIGDFSRPLELKAIEKHMNHGNAQITDATFPQRFQGISLKRNAPKVTGAVFPSGKVVCLSSKTEVEAKSAVNGMLGVVKQLIYPQKTAATIAAFEAAKTQQLVASFELGFEVQLEHLALKVKEGVTYEPEIYRNLFLQIPIDPTKQQQQPQQSRSSPASPCLAIISAKGRVMIAGARTEFDLVEAQKYLIPILTAYKRARPNYAL
ncbi:hypothetical protein BASA81_000060 [Batrachochytrium salamandrivorans]|nr:hypothetical protein BASA81_000060 [Batrachochytrium salamandrivorans]